MSGLIVLDPDNEVDSIHCSVCKNFNGNAFFMKLATLLGKYFH